MSVYKVPFEKNHRQATWQTNQNTDSISTAVPLQYSLITLKVIEKEKVTLSDMQSLKTVC